MSVNKQLLSRQLFKRSILALRGKELTYVFSLQMSTRATQGVAGNMLPANYGLNTPALEYEKVLGKFKHTYE